MGICAFQAYRLFRIRSRDKVTVHASNAEKECMIGLALHLRVGIALRTRVSRIIAVILGPEPSGGFVKWTSPKKRVDRPLTASSS